MATIIDQEGTYRGSVTETAFNTTKRGLPQVVAVFKAEEKYVEDAESLAHFGLEEPGWVDWTEFDEEITGYLVLFKDADEFSDDTALKNAQQCEVALGWSGDEFASFNSGEYDGKKVLFRVAEEEYQGKTSIKVTWIDGFDASPTREIRRLDSAEVKSLESKFRRTKKSKPVVAASKKTKAAATTTKPTTKAKGKAKKSAPESTSTAPTTSAAPAPAPVVEAPATTRPTTCTKDKAWEFVCKFQGDNTASDIQEAWLEAAQEVGAGREEAAFTDADWAKVRDLVCTDLDLDTDD